MKRLASGCSSIDKLLNGGIESGSITQVYGEPGTGKTTFCLQLACSCVRNEDKTTVYIDTESISIERLEQIGGPDIRYDRILFSKPYSLEEQEKMVKNAVKVGNIGLIVVDTINMFLRLKYHESPDDCTIPVLRMLETLYVASQKHDFPVVITSQVYQSKEDGEIRAFGGRDCAHVSKTILRFDRVAPGRRKAVIIKHRSIHDTSSAEFRITQKGLE